MRAPLTTEAVKDGASLVPVIVTVSVDVTKLMPSLTI